MFYTLLLVLTARRRKTLIRLNSLTMIRTPTGSSATLSKPSTSVWRRFVSTLTTNWIGRWSQNRIRKVYLQLLRSGNPLNVTVPEWIGLKVLSASLSGLAGVGLIIFSQGSWAGLVLLFSLVVLGWISPDFMLYRAGQRRRRSLERQLPNLLDLLSVSVEAGLGFEQALSRIGQKLQDPMAKEIHRLLGEIQYGSSRTEGLRRFAERTNVDSIRNFVSATIQADKLGIGMAQVLRVQSREVRRKRRMDAQEQAAKAPIRMLFPILLFIFPAIFIVILGPALLHIMQMFKNGI